MVVVVGVVGIWCFVNGGDLELVGRDENVGVDFYWNDVGNGLVGW